MHLFIIFCESIFSVNGLCDHASEREVQGHLLPEPVTSMYVSFGSQSRGYTIKMPQFPLLLCGLGALIEEI